MLVIFTSIDDPHARFTKVSPQEKFFEGVRWALHAVKDISAAAEHDDRLYQGVWPGGE